MLYNIIELIPDLVISQLQQGHFKYVFFFFYVDNLKRGLIFNFSVLSENLDYFLLYGYRPEEKYLRNTILAILLLVSKRPQQFNIQYFSRCTAIDSILQFLTQYNNGYNCKHFSHTSDNENFEMVCLMLSFLQRICQIANYREISKIIKYRFVPIMLGLYFNHEERYEKETESQTGTLSRGQTSSSLINDLYIFLFVYCI
ncbi:hypothetical protein RFI_13038 [Reticulomyxa filosa]|uniref:Uncharacterized protein n=1 Tax=Reticulomyxa filosa TaxID=46433 RepID=X6NE07_RETFI|nr:hypothetical protein RFI_13038 [Reticulomyxa filosa]|eukprot:ETO24123.1 hypothetical protein RFI_13038 [Reticulomyxa filosa]